MKGCIAAAFLCAMYIPTAIAANTPWNGAWKLDVNRSTPGIKDQAAEGYVFSI